MNLCVETLKVGYYLRILAVAITDRFTLTNDYFTCIYISIQCLYSFIVSQMLYCLSIYGYLISEVSLCRQRADNVNQMSIKGSFLQV